MSTRFEYDGSWDDADAVLAAGRWRGRRKRVLTGRPALAALKELEAALLALPHQRLISGSLCNGEGVCALGGWLYHRWVHVEQKMTPREAWDHLMHDRRTLHPTPGQSRIVWDWSDGDELDRSIDIGKDELGITQTLAEVIAEVNDELVWSGVARMGLQKVTPEARYQFVLKWVQSRLAGEKEHYF